MQAKVKADYPFDVVQAHTGREYVKYEWRAVPDGDAKIDLLDYQAAAPKPEPPAENPAAKPKAASKLKARRKPRATSKK